MIDPITGQVDDPFAEPDPFQGPGVAEVPFYEPPALTQPQIDNGVMFPRTDALNQIVGRAQSQDGKSYLDLDKGILQFNDGANDRLRMGSDQ